MVHSNSQEDKPEDDNSETKANSILGHTGISGNGDLINEAPAASNVVSSIPRSSIAAADPVKPLTPVAFPESGTESEVSL